MIVVKISKEETDDFKKCASFVGKTAKKSFGDNFKIVSNGESFTVISDSEKKRERVSGQSL